MNPPVIHGDIKAVRFFFHVQIARCSWVHGRQLLWSTTEEILWSQTLDYPRLGLYRHCSIAHLLMNFTDCRGYYRCPFHAKSWCVRLIQMVSAIKKVYKWCYHTHYCCYIDVGLHQRYWFHTRVLSYILTHTKHSSVVILGRCLWVQM